MSPSPDSWAGVICALLAKFTKGGDPWLAIRTQVDPPQVESTLTKAVTASEKLLGKNMKQNKKRVKDRETVGRCT